MKFKFVNFNLWYGKNWEKEIALLKSCNPEIFVLQEVTRHIPKFHLEKIDVLERLETSFGGFSGIYAAQTRKFENRREMGHGNVIFSKFPVVFSKIHYFFKKPDWPIGFEDQATGLLEMKVRMGKREVFIFTTHFSYSPGFGDNPRKIAEAEKTATILRKRQPFIFAGDLNSPPGSQVLRTIKKIALPVGNEDVPTWTTKPFSYHGFKETKLRWKLDYIFTSKEIRCTGWQAVNTGLSDHLALLAEFEING